MPPRLHHICNYIIRLVLKCFALGFYNYRHSLIESCNMNIVFVFAVSAIAEYSSFLVGDASTSYTMNAAGISGDAGDGLLNSNGYGFSTSDADHDASVDNCALSFESGWWFNHCHEGLLTGVYSDIEATEWGIGITWEGFGDLDHSRKTAIMSLQ